MLGTHAIVVGAGIGGLSAAQVLSEHFETVTVLERDVLPDGAEPRIGTPHCRHAHLLLKAGLNALLEFFPEFESELELAGAARARVAADILLETPGLDPWPQRDFGFDTFCMTRPLVESVARRLVERQGRIALLSRSRVTGLELSADTMAVSGVHYDPPDGPSRTLAADLVVDASSRGAPTLNLLDRLGLAKPTEVEIGIDLSYSTAIFEIPPDAPRNWRGVIHRAGAQSGRGAFLFPIENNRWQVSLNGMHGDAPPDDLPGFIAYAKTLRTPTVYEAIRDATAIGAIHRFGFPSSIRRRFEALTTFPRNILPVGDAICRFNPAFGQGMTVALQEINVLKRLLAERIDMPSPLASLAPAFFEAIQDVLAAPWFNAENDFVYAKTRGERPAGFDQRLKFGGALQRLAAEDAAVHHLLIEVNQLLKPPTVLREPHIVQKVTALMG